MGTPVSAEQSLHLNNGTLNFSGAAIYRLANRDSNVGKRVVCPAFDCRRAKRRHGTIPFNAQAQSAEVHSRAQRISPRRVPESVQVVAQTRLGSYLCDVRYRWRGISRDILPAKTVH